MKFLQAAVLFKTCTALRADWARWDHTSLLGSMPPVMTMPPPPVMTMQPWIPMQPMSEIPLFSEDFARMEFPDLGPMKIKSTDEVAFLKVEQSTNGNYLRSEILNTDGKIIYKIQYRQSEFLYRTDVFGDQGANQLALVTWTALQKVMNSNPNGKEVASRGEVLSLLDIFEGDKKITKGLRSKAMFVKHYPISWCFDDNLFTKATQKELYYIGKTSLQNREQKFRESVTHKEPEEV